MRIGIDIDDTLTNIKDKLTTAAFEYANSLNKSVENKDLQINDVYNNGNIYQKMFNFTYEELKYFLGPIQEEITNNAIPRPYCVDIINQLHNDGNEIYIITARDSEFHEDPYLQSEVWLNDNNIHFDKLIVNARDKKKTCLENNVDLFIDDGISNCLSVTSAGIMSLTIGNKKDIDYGIQNFDDWNQIYNFINNNKVFKVINYNDNYKNEVCNFINECMHKFIGRDYKERPDVSNIMEYYINNNGNFWLAIDVDSKKIIGTIALENRNNKYGILKRFYVDEEYQNNGVGSKLYEMFEIYVKNMTKIGKIYLACGSVLKKAHSFYESKGFIQQDSLDIDMHFAEDDDFFVKDINMEKNIRIGKKEENKEYYKRPGSYVIIEREEDNKIAIVTNGVGYFFLGGGLEKNETNEAALKRELIEESGYTLKDIEYFDMVSTYIYNEKKGYMDIDASIYIAKFDKKIAEPIEYDHKIIWVDPVEYKDKLYREYQRYILNRYVNNKIGEM